MSTSELTPQLFVSYSHRDTRLKERFEVHLGPLKHTSRIEIWSDTRLAAGDDWEAAILASLSRASLAVLLITADALNSEFIQNKEMPLVNVRKANEGLRFVPILAKDCAWELMPWLKRTEIRPVGAKPVWRKGRDPDRELATIAKEIDTLARIAKEAMKKEAKEQLPHDEIERQRREQEAATSRLLWNAHAGITAALNGDQQTAAAIYQQIQADAQKQRMQRWQILQDTQTKLFEIMQNVTINKKRTQDEAYKKWDEYIRQA